jgi:hypothetical protein
MRLEVHSEARAEFLHAVSFYNGQLPGLGLRFIAEIERCQKVLFETPLVGHPYGRRLRKFTVGDRVALGRGQPLFSGLHSPVDLRLISATPFGSGVVAAVYQPA